MKIAQLLALSAIASAPALHAQARLEHFQCYPVVGVNETQPVPGPVALQDQFSSTFEPVEVARPLRFCNPARKIHRNQAYGISDTKQHRL